MAMGYRLNLRAIRGSRGWHRFRKELTTSINGKFWEQLRDLMGEGGGSYRRRQKQRLGKRGPSPKRGR